MLSIYNASQRERAAVAAFRLLDADVTRALRKATAERVLPMARDAVLAEAETPVMRRIVNNATFRVSQGVPAIAFGGAKAVTSTGTPGRFLVAPLEFGSYGRRITRYDVAGRGTVHTVGAYQRTYGGHVETVRGHQRHTGTGTWKVRRHTNRQFLPFRGSDPQAITPGIEAISDDVLSVWFAEVERVIADALGGE